MMDTSVTFERQTTVYYIYLSECLHCLRIGWDNYLSKRTTAVVVNKCVPQFCVNNIGNGR